MTVVLAMIALASPLPLSRSADAWNAQTGLTLTQRMNELRYEIGAPTIPFEPQLSQAAEAHSNYVIWSCCPGGPHAERPGKVGFTGASPRARALAKGYRAQIVDEVLAWGTHGPPVVDFLWQLPYHRRAMMHPNAIGAGWGAATATHGGESRYGPAVGNIAYDPKVAAPEYLLDPAPGQVIRRGSVFLRETPDPLPAGAYPEVGYPITLVYSGYRMVTLRSATITHLESGANLAYYEAPQLSWATDTIILIPVQPLDGGQTFRVRIEVSVAGSLRTHDWQFSTPGEPHLRARLVSTAVSPVRLVRGTEGEVSLSYVNTGARPWRSRTEFPQTVYVGVRQFGPEWESLGVSVAWPRRIAAAQIPLGIEVPSGGSHSFRFRVQAPPVPGVYWVELGLRDPAGYWMTDDALKLEVHSTASPEDVNHIVTTLGPRTGYFRSSWLTQSPYPVMRVGDIEEVSITFQNTGVIPWVRGGASEARLGINGDDRTLAGLGMAVDWPIPDRPAIQARDIVLPGESTPFTFRVRAVRPGTYRLHLRPVIDGVTWMDDQGVYVLITVR